MITQEQVRRVREAAERLETAQVEFERVFREIAGPQGSVADTTKAKGRRKSTDGAGADPKPQYRAHLHVKCAACGKVQSGGKVVGDKTYPYRHANPEDTAICAGSDQPGAVVKS